MRYGMSSLIELLMGPRSVLSPVPPTASPLGTQIRAFRPSDKDAGGKHLDVKSAVLDGTGWDTCRELIHRMGIEATPLSPVPTADVWTVQPTSPKRARLDSPAR